ncbi:MerR HTH family regulatory protein [Amycolatopsis xylanica]|uniref:MerR HTH family regulatory protein n=1 Tax=Amycolatopsis xylanica TaxID=589385 RepID=A0A1H3PKI2_9PSEU|nr:MerR family transcriptional regulator [Amycolatopsis xylanica]SDZ01550.1 MerR HTH family regulatory protein [Amycolatopsis xylanica]
MTSTAIRYTIEELSTAIGMSTRNIRAHQTRGLLPAPIRDGRTVFYGLAHARRLQHIMSLQKQGFNLVSIAAVLGTGTADRDLERLTSAMGDIARDHPGIFYSLNRHGMLGWDESGEVRIARPGVLRAAVDMAKAGVPPLATLRFLGEVMDKVGSVAGTLVDSSADRLAGMRSQPAVAESDLDGMVATFGQGLVELLVGAFRAAVEHRSQAVVEGAMWKTGDADPWVEDAIVHENG